MSWSLYLLVACCLALSGCATGTAGGTDSATTPIPARRVVPPPTHTRFDYQIGAPYPPPAGVRVITRDRSAAPVSGLYNVCYVNAYQAQPGSTDWWRGNHPNLLLRNGDGRIVRDSNWHEPLLDISTPDKRTELATTVNHWVDDCARTGFAAVELDNLDSWTRSDGLLTSGEALDFARSIIVHAHADGLAVGQKNAADITRPGRAAGFDFAVTEQCADYQECDAYTATYGSEVIVIEYSAKGLAKACAGWATTLSIVRRDPDVTAPGSPGYVDQTC